MAKSAWQIAMDYAKAKQQASKLEEIAQSLTSVANDKMNSCMSQIQSNWKGDSASAYIRKVQKVQGDILKTAKSLKNAASAIRTVARNTRNADMRALELARARKYKS